MRKFNYLERQIYFRVDMMLRTSRPQRQVGKTGVRGFYIMRAEMKGLK